MPKHHEGQARVEREAQRFNVVACGRRWGKTTFGIDRVLRPALEGKPAGWFSPTYRMLLEVWREVSRRIRPVATKVNAQEKRMELQTGGVIEFWSLTDPDVARGRKYAQICVDEAAMVDDLEEAWQAVLRPTLTDYAGGAWFLSTPKGRNYFQQMFSWGQPDDKAEWASWQMPTGTNPHIPPSEIEAMKSELHSRVYAQEVDARFIEDVEGALWTWDTINPHRDPDPPDMQRIVIGVDPAGGGPDEVGIVVVGKSGGHAYVLQDASMRGSPNAWASAVASAYRRHKADRIVAERNFGGDMVESTIRTAGADLPVSVISASRGKSQRAEPVAALYEQGKVHHVKAHDELEDQMTTWDPANDKDSPDRVDALVWALTDLMLSNTTPTLSFA